MQLRGLRYFYGCVSVRVYGGFLENFINECSASNLKIWEIRYINGSVYFFTQEKFLPLLINIAEQSDLQLEITSEFGIPHLLRNNKQHIIMFVGLFVALLFVGLMNTRVWVIEVSGNVSLFDSEILEIMSELGVNVGVRKSKINAVEIQNEFLKIMKEDVLWVSLNVEGMCAEIQIREIEKVENDSIDQPCNYVADFNGIITTYRVFSGTPVVSKGEYVRTGDMLINSVIEYYDEGLNFVESRGLVIARRNKYVKTKMDFVKEKRSYMATEKRYALIVFGFEIPLSYNQKDNLKFETTKNERYLQINNVKLPFGLAEYTDSFYEKIADDKTDKCIALKKYISDIELQTRSSNVISLKTDTKNATGVYELNAEIDCLDYMGRKEIINIENIN